MACKTSGKQGKVAKEAAAKRVAAMPGWKHLHELRQGGFLPRHVVASWIRQASELPGWVQ